MTSLVITDDAACVIQHTPKSNSMKRAYKHGLRPPTKTPQKNNLQLFLVTNSLNLHQDPIRHNGVVI